ncbi:hypothetical protein HDU87_003187 [Geranomyces variabilis]|uniref:Dienelactone hydrolase domain-containing protein n=1 Tax=Geranomyces variabilis TaxID=109894 RepID=A0AAD5TKA8_9FUNG|nr:hypothetical protein HDU87_003187 [Geranomyces variabilis]
MSDLPDCCKTGYLHDPSAAGGLRGQELSRHGLNVYVSRPPSTTTAQKKKAVILLSDVFGWKYPNTRILADRFALAGYTAFLPDMFDGGALPYESYTHIIANQEPPKTLVQYLVRATHLIKAVPTGVPFLLKYGRKQPLGKVQAFAKGLKTRRNDQGDDDAKDDAKDDDFDVVVVVGYCFGGRYAALLAAAAGDDDLNTTPLVSASCVVHPGEIAVPAEITPIVAPTLFLHAIDDPFFAGRKAAEQALKDKNANAVAEGDKEVVYEFVDYERPHGFALRADVEDGEARRVMEDALRRCLEWFDRYG